MLQNHLKNVFLRHLRYEPTEGQNILMDALSQMICSVDPRQLMIIRGYAGTGKTSVIAAFIRTLADFKIESVLVAPTGRAAKVLSRYSGMQA